MHEKTSNVLERFTNVKGWIQEDLFWELPVSKERISRINDQWVYDRADHPIVEPELWSLITPVQHARFFDAATAEWAPESNLFTAYDAAFALSRHRPTHYHPHHQTVPSSPKAQRHRCHSPWNSLANNALSAKAPVYTSQGVTYEKMAVYRLFMVFISSL